MISILMTGGGAPGAPGILKCLTGDKYRVWVCDSRDNVSGKYLNDHKFFTIPQASDPEFVTALLKRCKEHNISVILPLVTRELFVLSQHKELFDKEGIIILVSEYDALLVANDKGKLYEHFTNKQSCEFIPDFEIVDNLKDLESAICTLGYPGVDVCIKPSLSNGSRGFRVISEQMDDYDLLFNHKPTSTFIRFDMLKRILNGRPLPKIVVSEYLPGDEYSVDCIAEHGNAKVIVPRIRTRMIGGISVEGTILENKEIIEHSRFIINDLKLHGNIGLQFKESSSGIYKLLEINPRVQGTIVSVMGAGINMPLCAVKMALKNDWESGLKPIRWGTKFIRFWDEIFYK